MFQNTIIVGYAGRDAEVRTTSTGKTVVNFNIAVNERLGEKEVTTWFKVTCWNGLATAAQHIKKGQLVLVEGRAATEVWLNTKSAPKATIVITADKMRFLGAKPADSK